jgi:hypothetical protein
MAHSKHHSSVGGSKVSAMKRKPKKPVRSRLVRKWDGTPLVPEEPPTPIDDGGTALQDREPHGSEDPGHLDRRPTLEDLFIDEEETIEHDS